MRALSSVQINRVCYLIDERLGELRRCDNSRTKTLVKRADDLPCRSGFTLNSQYMQVHCRRTTGTTWADWVVRMSKLKSDIPENDIRATSLARIPA